MIVAVRSTATVPIHVSLPGGNLMRPGSIVFILPAIYATTERIFPQIISLHGRSWSTSVHVRAGAGLSVVSASVLSNSRRVAVNTTVLLVSGTQQSRGGRPGRPFAALLATFPLLAGGPDLAHELPDRLADRGPYGLLLASGRLLLGVVLVFEPRPLRGFAARSDYPLR